MPVFLSTTSSVFLSTTSSVFLSTTSSVLLSTAFTTSYLASIYVLPHTRIDSSTSSTPPTAAANPPRPRDRNHPSIIRARLVAVTLSSLVSASSLFVLPLSPSAPTALSLLGLPPTPVARLPRLVLLPLGLTATLFTGSIWIVGLRRELPFQRGWSWRRVGREVGGLEGVRNYVLGPLTEEIVFRSCIVAVSALAGFSKTQIVFLSPLYFGIAHVHHAWETYVKGGRTRQALVQGVMQSTFQFAYTTLFGWYASFLFMRTGSLIPAFLAHAFCNLMGLPPLGWALQVFPDKKISIWGAYGAGVAGFVYGLWRWTEPALYGGSIYWV